ncbi:MAG TPA: hypothetical protein VIL69_19820 [Roseomonas sp.]
MATKWDGQLGQAVAARGTATITCSEGEKDDIAAAAQAVGARHGLRPQIDRAPANGIRVGYRMEIREPEGPAS